MIERSHKTTGRIDMPGGQDRLRQMILYVARMCVDSPRFGAIKLNKIIWKADFSSYAERGTPITGRAYQRLRLGPAPKEMVPIHRDMLTGGLISVERVDFGDGIVEERTVALQSADLSKFDPTDIEYVDASIAYYWFKTGMEASDDSHGIAWLTRSNGELMPYESAILSDRRPRTEQLNRIRQRIRDRGLLSQ